MTTAALATAARPLDEPAPITAAPRAPATLARPARSSVLAQAGVVFCLLELVAAWGWLHWRADIRALAPAPLVTSMMRSAFLLMFVSAIAQAWARAPASIAARDAACVGAAALLLHAPWTLIVLKWPNAVGFWLFVMTLTAVAATAKLGRDRVSAALVAAPYTAWLVFAAISDAGAAALSG